MTEYRYKLKNLRPPMRCPQCGRKSFSPYVDTQTGEIVAEDVGMCSHKVSCAYHKPPTKDDLNANKPLSKIVKGIDTRKPFFLDNAVYEQLQKNDRIDNFSTGLRTYFSNADEVLSKYGVVCGSAGRKYQNYTGFPYIQQDGTLKSVKMMMYNSDLHRSKDDEGNGIVNWLHYFHGFDKAKDRFDACWFGEQLIDKNDYDYIGIVESEKTCIIATCCLPSVLWLACGSIGNKKQIIGKGLKQKKVVFFPDANGFENWNEWVMTQRQPTWKVSKLPQTLSGGDDIADALLKNSNYAETIMQDIQRLFGEFFDRDALRYYNSLTATFSVDDWANIFERNNMPYICESETSKDENGKYKETIKFFRPNERKELNFLQVFTGQQLDDFCTEYHFPKYEDLKAEKFSLNFTPEMLMKFLSAYPKSFFNNFVFNVDEMSFNYRGDRFELLTFLSEKMKNIETSSLNAKTKIKLFKKNEPILKEFCSRFEFAKKIPFKNKSLGIYEEVLNSGMVFCENNGFKCDMDDWGKWVDIFTTIWKIDEESIMAMLLFTIFNMRCRIEYDTRNLRLLNIIGDGGVGKDTTLISLLIGLWRSSHSERIWEGSTFGVSGFTAETPDKVNSFLLQVISDDLKAANASATFEQISNPLLKIENKGQQPIRVLRRFMQVNTNNNSRFSFEKLSKNNRNAFARRMLVMQVFSKTNNPDQLRQYKELFEFFREKEHQTLFHGWWYWCYQFSKNTDALKKIDDYLYKEMQQNAEKYTYLNKEDDVILTELERLCEGAQYEDNFNFHNVIKGDKFGTPYFIFKTLAPLYDNLHQKFGKETIKSTISNKFGDKAIWAKSFRPKNSTEINYKTALQLPCSCFEEASQPDIISVENHADQNTEPLFDIISALQSKVVF